MKFKLHPPPAPVILVYGIRWVQQKSTFSIFFKPPFRTMPSINRLPLARHLTCQSISCAPIGSMGDTISDNSSTYVTRIFSRIFEVWPTHHDLRLTPINPKPFSRFSVFVVIRLFFSEMIA